MDRNLFRILGALGAVTVLLTVAAFGADAPTTAPTSQPAIIHAGDKAAIDANMDKDVVVDGLCSLADWSGSGKVMNLRFEGTQMSKFSAVVFVKNRDKIDAAFGGNAAVAWTGAKLRIKGKLELFVNKAKGSVGVPEIKIDDPSQVTVVELPATQPG